MTGPANCPSSASGSSCCCTGVKGCSGSYGTCYSCSGGYPYCAHYGCTVGQCDLSVDSEPNFSGDVLLDPHFYGLNGHKYNFQGEVGKVFALISEPFVQVNARFANASGVGYATKDGTVMGEICVRFCDSTVQFDRSGSVIVSGRASSNLVVNRRAPSTKTRSTTDLTAGLWSFTVELDSHLGDGHHHQRPFFNLKHIKLQQPIFAGQVHGVLGVTAPEHQIPGLPFQNATRTAHGPRPHPHCNPHNEGDCEVPGEWHEYEIQGNDLCGTEFKYSKFDSNKCASIAANLKRGVAEVNLVQQALQSILP